MLPWKRPRVRSACCPSSVSSQGCQGPFCYLRLTPCPPASQRPSRWEPCSLPPACTTPTGSSTSATRLWPTEVATEAVKSSLTPVLASAVSVRCSWCTLLPWQRSPRCAPIPPVGRRSPFLPVRPPPAPRCSSPFLSASPPTNVPLLSLRKG